MSFWSWLRGETSPKSKPEPKVLIQFTDCADMGFDWREDDRGLVVGSCTKTLYNGNPGGGRADYYIVARPDGTTFLAYKGDVREGQAHMQAYTHNPSEDLRGKLVYVN